MDDSWELRRLLLFIIIIIVNICLYVDAMRGPVIVKY